VGPFQQREGPRRVYDGAMADQLDIFGGSTSYGPPRQPAGQDSALQARLGRKHSNRIRLEGTPATREREFGNGEVDFMGDPLDTHSLSMSDLGIRNVANDVWSTRTMNAVPYGPHDASTFRKAGVQREVPLYGPDAITTMQEGVHPGRVAEISEDPSSGIDPRGIPGNELPLSVQAVLPSPQGAPATPNGMQNTDIIWNGNHRVAAAIDRGEMFTPVQSITRGNRERASDTYHRDKARFSDSREQKYNLGATRMVMGDATIRQPADDWEEMLGGMY